MLAGEPAGRQGKSGQKRDQCAQPKSVKAGGLKSPWRIAPEGPDAGGGRIPGEGRRKQNTNGPPFAWNGGPSSGDASEHHRTGPMAQRMLVAAASRFAAGGLAAHGSTAAAVAAAMQPAAELLERPAAGTAARIAAGLAARRFAADGLTADRFAARRLAAARLATGRLAAGVAAMAVVVATDQAVEQLERLGVRRAGHQRNGENEGGEQDSTFHGDCSFKQVRRESGPFGSGGESQLVHSFWSRELLLVVSSALRPTS